MGDESSLMLFSVREFLFAIEIGSLLEVTQIDAVNIHQEEGPFKYSFDFRGARTPIIDLAEIAGRMPAPMAGSMQLLVVDSQTHPFAFLIDRVSEVAKGKGAVYRFPEMLRTERNRFIRAIYLIDNRMSYVFDPDLLLKEDEIAALRTFKNG